MKVLDLFCGLGGWGSSFRDRGHDVCTLDFEPSFEPDFCCDIRQAPLDELKSLGPWDIILASPPCEKFSVLQIGRNWTKDHQPKTEGARQAIEIVEATVALIKALEPTAFIIENPRAKLRRLPIMAQFERRTVTYCQYGEPFMKPTDLWGGFPDGLVLKPPCKNGDPCHVAAPRGSTTGIQGDLAHKDSLEWRQNRRGNLTMHKRQHREMYGTSDSKKLAALRAVIPYELSLAVCLAMEGEAPAEWTGQQLAMAVSS